MSTTGFWQKARESVRTGSVIDFPTVFVEQPHVHDFLELAYVKSGGVRHSCDGQRQYISAGSYLLIDDSVAHCYEKVELGTCIVNCIFRPGFIDSTLHGCRRFDDVARHYWFRMGDGIKNGGSMRLPFPELLLHPR